MRIVAPWGFYGMGNTGDEGTLCGFARLLSLCRIDASASIGSGDPAHTALAEPAFSYFSVAGKDPRRWWAKLRGDAHAVIGGTPIMDVLDDWPLRDLVPLLKSADRRRIPFVVVGSGIEDLQHESSRLTLQKEIIPRVKCWSVRSTRDAERLRLAGVPDTAVTVAADLAWLIEPVGSCTTEELRRTWGVDDSRPLIGVNICNERLCLDRNPGMVEVLASALDDLVSEHDALVVFICAEVRDDREFDRAAARLVLERMSRADRAVLPSPEYYTPRQLMAFIGRCRLIVSMRYHVCLFSALQGVPFLALERSDKVADLCWDLAWKSRLPVPFDQGAGALQHCSSLLGQSEPLRRHLQERCGEMFQRALLNRAPIESLYNPS